MTLNIRPAVPDDLPHVHQMMADLARHHGDVATISAAALHHQIFDLRKGRIIVAAEEEGLVGYALLLVRPNLVTGGDGHDINHLFVVEWRRRAGIGRALIAAARGISAMENAELLTIGTHPANHDAQGAYRGMGLEELPVPGPRFRIALG
jgi:GNAT superfamily N-acetyltransferase